MYLNDYIMDYVGNLCTFVPYMSSQIGEFIIVALHRATYVSCLYAQNLLLVQINHQMYACIENI